MATNPPCFAFVNYKHRDDAEEAIRAMDGKYVNQQMCFPFNMIRMFQIDR